MSFLQNKPTRTLIFLFLTLFFMKVNAVSASEAQFAKCNALKGELQKIEAAFKSNSTTYRDIKRKTQTVADECNRLKEEITSSFGKVTRPQFAAKEQSKKNEYAKCPQKLSFMESEMNRYVTSTRYNFELYKNKNKDFQACINDYNYADKNKAWYEKFESFIRVVAEESEEAANNIRRISELRAGFK